MLRPPPARRRPPREGVMGVWLLLLVAFAAVGSLYIFSLVGHSLSWRGGGAAAAAAAAGAEAEGAPAARRATPAEPGDCIPRSDAGAWWEAAPAIVECAVNVTARPRADTLALVVALKGDGGDGASLGRWDGGRGLYDLVVASDDAQALQAAHLAGMPALRLAPQADRVAVWNALQAAGRDAGYMFLLVAGARTVVPRAAAAAVRDALTQGATLALPTMNRAAAGASQQWWARGADAAVQLSAASEARENAEVVQFMLSSMYSVDRAEAASAAGGAGAAAPRLAVAACFFGLHLKHVMRFAPDLDNLFSSTTPHPGDDVVVRMLAARDDPFVVKKAFVFCDSETAPPLLADVSTSKVPGFVEITELRPRARPRRPALPVSRVPWPLRADLAIKGCDWDGNYQISATPEACQAVCDRMAKCKGFSLVAGTRTCYLKSCARRLYSLEGVHSYLRPKVGISAIDLKGGLLCSANIDAAAKPVPKSKKTPKARRIAILVTVHDAREWVALCVTSLWDMSTPSNVGDAIYLVNDASSPATLAGLKALVDSGDAAARKARHFNTKLVNWQEGSLKLSGYTRAINHGLRAAWADGGYDAYCLLNSDTQVLSPTWLAVLEEALFADAGVGVVGPLSNAASYQSVPLLREQDANGTVDWSKNALPDGTWDPQTVARAVARASRGSGVAIRVPVLNGFCLLIKHAVFLKVGLFDDVAFPHGFGEENDFALRASHVGYELRVVDGVYIWHHKSKSYGDATRVALSRKSRTTMKQRWGAELTQAVRALESNAHLGELRRRVAQTVHASKCRANALRVLFVLNPTRAITVGGTKQPLAMHGGWISIMNQALGLNQRGACAMVAVSAWTVPSFEDNFPAASGGGVLLPYADTVRSSAQLAAALFPHAPAFDVLVGTLFTTIDPIAAVIACHPTLQPAYFIQDYEADFDNLTPELHRMAVNSYTRMPTALLFAKTAWLRRKVAAAHNVTVHMVRGSIDLSAFAGAREAHLRTQPSTEALAIAAAAKSASAPGLPQPLASAFASPAAFGAARPVRVVAMVRPSTPRRNPLGTLQVLRNLKDLNRPFGATRVVVETFGCSHAELRHLLESTAVLPSWRLDVTAILREHRGTLDRDGVAALFAESDVFVDMSRWQAFGRTGLEAMAAGVVPVLPIGSGSEEYATDGFNSRLINTTRVSDAVAAVSAMVQDSKNLERMRCNALDTVLKYDMATSSLSVLAIICEALEHNRRAVALMPSPCRFDKHLDFAHGRIFPGSTAQLRWADVRAQLEHSTY